MKTFVSALMCSVACICGVAQDHQSFITVTNFNGKRIRTCPSPAINEPRLDDYSDKMTDCCVPQNWTNIALRKTVTASSESFMSDLSGITDGITAFDITNAVLLVESAAAYVPWVQINLDEEKPIFAVRIWHRYEPGFKFCFRDVVVQLFDPDTRTPPKTLFNNDYDNTSELGQGTDRPYVESASGKLILLSEPATGRYVRVYTGNNCWGSDGSYFAEVQVFGPAEGNKESTK